MGASRDHGSRSASGRVADAILGKASASVCEQVRAGRGGPFPAPSAPPLASRTRKPRFAGTRKFAEMSRDGLSYKPSDFLQATFRGLPWSAARPQAQVVRMESLAATRAGDCDKNQPSQSCSSCKSCPKNSAPPRLCYSALTINPAPSPASSRQSSLRKVWNLGKSSLRKVRNPGNGSLRKMRNRQKVRYEKC